MIGIKLKGGINKMKKYRFDITWKEIYGGEFEVEAKNIDEAKKEIKEKLDINETIRHIIEGAAEDFRGTDLDNVIIKEVKKDEMS